jgi:diguanylate cyclase (GGDEF)-like protein
MGIRRRHETGLFATERAPRLVLRFAVVLSLALALASAAILLVVHHFAVTTAERAATRQAGLVASTIFQREVAAADVHEPVGPARAKELDELFERQLVTEDVLSVSLVRRDGTVTFSTDHTAIGTRVDAAPAAEAASGAIVSRTADTPDSGGTSTLKTLETFAPVGADIRDGAALIRQSYAPIHRDARAAQLRVGVVLEALLIVLVLVFIPVLARVTRKIEAQIAKIHQQAFYDTLTGLPNRTHLFERLGVAVTRAKRDGRPLTVLLADLDRFREINDTLGHDVGDTVLVEIADRLRTFVGSGYLLARFGGDEFVVVGEFDGSDGAEEFAEQLRAAVEPPIVLDGMPLAVDATVGIAAFPGDGSDAETLLKHAEVATHTAKEWRRGVLGYSPAVDPHDPEQLKLATALREAAARGEVRPHFQPKVDLATSTVAGFEALAYWEHPTRGLLPPGAFIPVAERTGAIRHVTRAVLERALDELVTWPGSELTVAVNLTAIDLLDAELPEHLAALTSSRNVEPGRLWLELTESTVMADPERAKEVLERIVATGVRVSVDDFGTGHSSLAYLKDLPVGEVKIDRSFISDMALSRSDRMIVKATVQLAHSLGLQTVAEGVEDPKTHTELRGLGCDYGQGYLYGKPLPGELVREALERRDVEAA